MFSKLQRESEALIHGFVELVYFMRGAISYDEVMWRTRGERQIMLDFINKRLDIEFKKPNPTY